MEKTLSQYDKVSARSKDIFLKKMKDYGTAWRILRLSSITDQIFIKAQRIRSIEEKGTQKVADDIAGEYIGILNYSIIALIQLELGLSEEYEMESEKAASLYNKYVGMARNLMENKNHDYGEAWRDMRISSITDLILMKILRVRQIEDNKGKTIISEGLDANYLDMVNYAVFALIRLDEAASKSIVPQ
ncbi:MAG: DUF1599 domain-containing protein [Flavobacteriales bacterium]|nr:DUF1599 domain-containing protein [Flavobacteriales bacterium]MCB9447793.1 DUF1599 domain-containing protein [Flavobacteriales bacterium]